MDTTDLYAQEIQKLNARVDGADLRSNEDVRQFISDITKLIYDYKMIGRIYDFYTESVEYHKQNKVIFTSVEDVVRNVAEFSAAFPNLKTNIENIIVYKVDDDFFKISKRLHYWGNNYGQSKFGPSTGKSLANNCLGMSLIHLKRVEGQWKITFEINSDSEQWLEQVQTSARTGE